MLLDRTGSTYDSGISHFWVLMLQKDVAHRFTDASFNVSLWEKKVFMCRRAWLENDITRIGHFKAWCASWGFGLFLSMKGWVNKKWMQVCTIYDSLEKANEAAGMLSEVSGRISQM